jgi:LuxR family transcriptional regulator
MAETADLIDQIDALLNAQTVDAVWELHTARMAHYGFDRVLYGFTRYRTSSSLGAPDDILVLSNHDRAYVEAFVQSGLFAEGPMVQWALQNEGATSWRLIGDLSREGRLTDVQKQVVELNKQYGLTAGYSISFRDTSKRAKGAIGLSARWKDQDWVDDIWARHGAEIHLTNKIVHLKLTSLPHPGRRLTQRQREVLEWVGDGKTVQDIAMLLGVAPATVDKHLRLAREALSAETTAQAVLKASINNQIFLP